MLHTPRPEKGIITLFFLLFAGAFRVCPPPALAQPADGLKIVDVLFEDYDGWQRPQFQMNAGGEVVLTFRVEGFGRLSGRSAEGLQEEQVRLQYEVALRDPQNVLVAPAEQGEVQARLGPRDEHWTPLVRWSASVPSYAPGGDYRIHLRVKDRIAEKDVARQVSFRVRGESVRSSRTLAVQQVEYARSEQGPWFRQRYFSPQDPTFVRYKIAGFQVSPQNEVWVEQDWTLLNEDGQVIVQKENAVVVKSQEFYPPRVLSTFFQLEMEEPKPGAYTLQILVRDRIGQQAVSLDSQFFLRP